MSDKPALYDTAPIEQLILLLRGHRVILDRDLAALYGVATKNLNKAVARNPDRFPSDFMFQLTQEEALASRFQTGTLKRGQNIKYLPYAFTEEGVAMLSSVLRSPQAIQVNVAIMRAFVRLRETLAVHRDLAHKLAELERRIEGHDESIHTLFEAIRHLMAPPDKPRRRIGFHVRDGHGVYRIRHLRRQSLGDTTTRGLQGVGCLGGPTPGPPEGGTTSLGPRQALSDVARPLPPPSAHSGAIGRRGRLADR
ncbi:MAG: hypothetical protein A3K19_12400 [Lentisphaerae bacterium RIFOXYB12_FULL_65_16]|nr:MAG: hypothetical protein A3K18_11725 [Lentisphaerae bacterium RIFOXYA12_64_32]OGV84399.1 MAG: hypothetical protein A3K19_12400 [Lentisphaerae bacterium RIFOXYB12_FULL_65_16]